MNERVNGTEVEEERRLDRRVGREELKNSQYIGEGLARGGVEGRGL